jgi:hypothetical protein
MLNKFITTNYIKLLGADGRLTNPAINSWGDDPDRAEDGSLFLEIAVNFWRVAITIGALYVLGSFLLAAFEWIGSGGDKGKLESARNRGVNAAIGLILLVSSFTIVTFLGDLFFGEEFNLLELTLPTPE